MELALCAKLYSLAETPQTPLSPHLGSYMIRGRYWSAKIDDISLWLTLINKKQKVKYLKSCHRNYKGSHIYIDIY